MLTEQSQRAAPQSRGPEAPLARAAHQRGPAAATVQLNARLPDNALSRQLADAVRDRVDDRGARAGDSVAAGVHRSARPTLQRLVRWDTSKTPSEVESITLDRIGSTGGGAHSSSYQLFLETVQNAVVGADYLRVVGRLNALYKDVKNLPGWDASDKKMTKLAAAFTDSYADAVAAATDVANHSYYVEILASDYVRLRNALNFNYLEAGEGDIGGWSEAKHLKEASAAHQAVDWDKIEAVAQKKAKKRSHKEAFQVENADTFIEHSADLLDTRNVAPPKKKKTETAKQAQTRLTAWETRWSNIIKQHIGTVIAAHPGVDAAAVKIVTDLTETLGADIHLSQTARDAIVADLTVSKAGWGNIETAS